ncbi:hypothetical protein Pelo_15951 [Pelomyxa schiedti]|nr:hypothetical protein Pelo_15951 [Pelomyxa schiedti]
MATTREEDRSSRGVVSKTSLGGFIGTEHGLYDLEIVVASHDGLVLASSVTHKTLGMQFAPRNTANCGFLPGELPYLAKILCPPMTKASAAFEGSGDWPEGTLIGNISLDPLLQVCGFLDNRGLVDFQLVCKTWRNFFVSNEQQIFCLVCFHHGIKEVCENVDWKELYIRHIRNNLEHEISLVAKFPSIKVKGRKYFTTKISEEWIHGISSGRHLTACATFDRIVILLMSHGNPGTAVCIAKSICNNLHILL